MSAPIDPSRDVASGFRRPPQGARGADGPSSEAQPQDRTVPRPEEPADGQVLAEREAERAFPGHPAEPRPGVLVREVRLESGEAISYEWVRDLF